MQGIDPLAVVNLGADPAFEEDADVRIERQPGELREQAVVCDVVEETIDVRVDQPAEALPPELIDAQHGVAHRAAFAVGVAARLEFGLEDRPGDQIDRRLQDPVADGGHTEGAHLRLVLRNVEP